MSFKAAINRFRRKVMHSLTGNIGSQQDYVIPGLNPQKILVIRANHRLGNQLLLSPLILELEWIFPEAKVDLFVRGGASRAIYENYPTVNEIFTLPGKPFKALLDYCGVWLKVASRRYDLVINATGGSSSGKLATKLAKSESKIYGNTAIDKLPLHMAQAPVQALRNAVDQANIPFQLRPIPGMNIRLSRTEIDAGAKKLHEIAASHQPVIALFTYATGSKRYEDEYWAKVRQTLEKQFLQYTLIEVLPVENISAFGHTLPHFYSRDLREIAAVLYNCKIFIAADSGMMHLGEAAHVPTLGLFKVTSPEKYGPYGEGSSSIDTNRTTIDDLMTAVRAVLE